MAGANRPPAAGIPATAEMAKRLAWAEVVGAGAHVRTVERATM